VPLILRRVLTQRDRAAFRRQTPICQSIEIIRFSLGAGEANRTPDPNLGKDIFPLTNPQESWLFDRDRMGTDPEWAKNKRERNPSIIPDRNPELAIQAIIAGPSISAAFHPTKATRHRKIRSMASPYSFRPFTPDDLHMVARWLETPEVLRWWGDSHEQLALIAGDLSEPLMDQWLAEHEGKPFAYLQAYPAHAWPQVHFAHLPATGRVIDVFVGDPEMIGRGHGRAFLRDFAEMLIANGASLVATDPLSENHRARRAYSRAGFVEDKVASTADGLVAVMVFKQRHTE